MRLDYRISYLLSVFKKEFVEVFPMQDSGADGTAPAFDSSSESFSLASTTVAAPLPQSFLSMPEVHVHHLPGHRHAERGKPGLEEALTSHQEPARAWLSELLSFLLCRSHPESSVPSQRRGQVEELQGHLGLAWASSV